MKPEHDRIPWEDVEVAASKMFNVWLGDGEIKWVEECWQHFGEANLTDNSPALARTATFLRLLTLARIYEEFCGLAWDENLETPVEDNNPMPNVSNIVKSIQDIMRKDTDTDGDAQGTHSYLVIGNLIQRIRTQCR